MTDDKKRNPWKLTPRECQALAAVIQTGNNKAAGRQLGVEAKTVETLTKQARGKMQTDPAIPLSRVQAVVLWDRWSREHQKAEAVLFDGTAPGGDLQVSGV